MSELDTVCITLFVYVLFDSGFVFDILPANLLLLIFDFHRNGVF